MEQLILNATPKTPEVNFNPNGELNVSGVSVPENSLLFYNTITDWLKLYIEQPQAKTNLIFKLSYINTSSLQFIYDIIMLLDSVHPEKTIVTIHWHYFIEDDDMKEVGVDFNDTTEIQFNFVEEN